MALVERKLQLIDWKTPGTKIGGFLVRANRVKFNDGGTAMRYLFQGKNGVMTSFPGATQLDLMIQRDDLGCYMEVHYKGEDTSRQMAEGRNRPKLFSVLIDTEERLQAVAAGDAPEITDDDIPF